MIGKADLGFCVDDRRENIRRIAEASKLMTEAGVINRHFLTLRSPPGIQN